MKRFRSLCHLLVATLLLETSFISAARAGEDVSVKNVRFEMSGQVINVFYDLQGPEGENYNVRLLLKRKQNPSFQYAPRSLTGDFGQGRFAGIKRQITWDILKEFQEGLEGTDYYFVVEAEMISSGTSILWYIGGGAAIIAGAAVLLLGKQAQTGTAATDVFPKPIGRPAGN
ncbi:MAG: hypothetical protein NTZ35_10400 [Ignavibacteriales bacterium]|nr:hypothetical protein [Ignavibacteriales bacterium]